MQGTAARGRPTANRTIIAVRTGGRHDMADVESLRRLAGALRVGDMAVDSEHGVAGLADLVMEDQADAPRECLSPEVLAG